MSSLSSEDEQKVRNFVKTDEIVDHEIFTREYPREPQKELHPQLMRDLGITRWINPRFLPGNQNARKLTFWFLRKNFKTEWIPANQAKSNRREKRANENRAEKKVSPDMNNSNWDESKLPGQDYRLKIRDSIKNSRCNGNRGLSLILRSGFLILWFLTWNPVKSFFFHEWITQTETSLSYQDKGKREKWVKRIEITGDRICSEIRLEFVAEMRKRQSLIFSQQKTPMKSWLSKRIRNAWILVIMTAGEISIEDQSQSKIAGKNSPTNKMGITDGRLS